MISYERFWVTLKRKGITQYALIHKFGISAAVLQRIRENQNMHLSTIDKLCRVLDCGIGDIMEFVGE